MITRAQWVRSGYTVANVYIAAAALLVFSHISDHGASIILYSLFFMIPLSVVVLWGLNRRCRTEHSRPQRAYLIASRIVLFVAWLFSCLPVVIWIGLTQPWPLTLRNGPDTNYSQQGFARLVGFTPPASVSDIYYREDGGIVDSGRRLRFRCNDGSLVTQMVARLHLQETSNPMMGLSSTESPKWWAERAQHRGLRQYTREEPNRYYWCLWCDPVTGTVWYEEYSM